ncbi:hypothetical protein ACN99C_26655 (plasmid) [Pseudomonas alloputida]|uniref:hypothetical protein n=1 Tax=Pseudomonas alloputida TaxID=1940621 RepID=UPI003B431033
MKHDYPEYPSVAVTVDPLRYLDAAEALKGVSQVFFDGETILVPERETEAIEMLRAQFDARLVYGQASEYEYATRARDAGVGHELLRLGQAVYDCTGLDAAAMVHIALTQPSQTLLAWKALYRSSMIPH